MQSQNPNSPPPPRPSPPVAKSEPAPAPPPPSSPESVALLARLQNAGVHHRIAHKLVSSNAPEIVSRALEHLAGRTEVQNKAGWLVREIEAGGYSKPKQIQVLERHRAIGEARSQERRREQSIKEAENQNALHDWAAFEQLELPRRNELIAAARAQLARVSSKLAAAAEDCPMMKGAILALYREQRGGRPPSFSSTTL